MEIDELRIGKYKYNGCKESAIGDPYSVGKTYVKGDLVMNNGYLYSALVDMDAGEWDGSKWLKTSVVDCIPSCSWEDLSDEYYIGPSACRYFFLKVNRNQHLIYVDIATPVAGMSLSCSAHSSVSSVKLLEFPASAGIIHAVGIATAYTGDSAESMNVLGNCTWYYNASAPDCRAQYYNSGSSSVTINSFAFSGFIPYIGTI